MAPQINVFSNSKIRATRMPVPVAEDVNFNADVVPAHQLPNTRVCVPQIAHDEAKTPPNVLRTGIGGEERLPLSPARDDGVARLGGCPLLYCFAQSL